MQPSCFFTRAAWEAAGPLDESIHFALDLDLWLRMVKHFEFVPVDALLSRALIHDDAKTTAQRNLMVVDSTLVIIRHGGERFVRRHLDRLAERLTSLEKRRIRNRLPHPGPARGCHPLAHHQLEQLGLCVWYLCGVIPVEGRVALTPKRRIVFFLRNGTGGEGEQQERKPRQASARRRSLSDAVAGCC